MTFAQPLWLLLGLVVPLLWILPRRLTYLVHSGVGMERKRAASSHCILRLPMTLSSLALICFTVALAGPRVFKADSDKQILARDIMIAEDFSGSMGAPLPGYTSPLARNGNRQARRIDAAQDAILSFAKNRFELKTGDRVGMILFDDSPRVAWPLTDDLKQIFRRTDFLPSNLFGEKVLGSGTNFGAKGPGPIDEACSHFRDYGESPARVLIMVTDGEDEISDEHLKRLSALMKKHNVKLYVVGVGQTLATREVDIKRLARDYMDGGENSVFLVEKADDMQKCFNTIDQLERGPVTVTSFNNFQELYQYPLVAGFLLIFLWTISLLALLGV
ncbi:MAG: VWA domain-containing protein [Candidatus Obscuribacterales bacterium]|nr:VWA domain-containing protein [Candidatus Obscuribacterales bacterium]